MSAPGGGTCVVGPGQGDGWFVSGAGALHVGTSRFATSASKPTRFLVTTIRRFRGWGPANERRGAAGIHDVAGGLRVLRAPV